MSEQERKIYLKPDDIEEQIDLDAEVEEDIEIIDDTGDQPCTEGGANDAMENDELSEDEYELIDDTQDESGTSLRQPTTPKVITDQDKNRNTILTLPDISASEFSKHTASVLCCDISRDSLIAVTGGQDDKAFVWNIQTKDVIFDTDTIHDESISVAKFNRNSKLLVTGDVNGRIELWDLVKSPHNAGTYTLCDQVTWLFWDHRSDYVFYAGSESGEAYLYDITPGRFRTHSFPTFGTNTNCAKLFHKQNKIVIGYGNGCLRVFGLDNTQKTLLTLNVSTKEVVSVDISADDNLIAAGSVDSVIKVFKAHNGELTTTFQNAHGPEYYAMNDRMNSVESILFTMNNTLTTGMVMESLKVWDLNTGLNRFDLKLKYGVFKIIPDKNLPHIIYVGCLDGLVRVIDVRTCEVVKELTGHKDQLIDICLAPNNKFILTASDDKKAKIFKL